MRDEVGGAIGCAAVGVVEQRIAERVVVRVGLAAASRVALTLALQYETQQAHGDLEYARQVHVVVDGQQVAVLVRVEDVELDAVEAVQALDQLIELVELGHAVPVEADASKLGIVLHCVVVVGDVGF